MGNSQDIVCHFFDTVYGPAAPGVLVLWTRQDKRSRCFDASNLSTAARAATATASSSDVYTSLGLRKSLLHANKRGAAKDVIAIPGLVADIDIQGAAHKQPDLPATLEDALSLLSELPVQPTLIVCTGHGIQPWWLFRELWTFDSPEEWAQANDLSRRFQALLQEHAARRGWKIDNVGDLARVLRIPGTVNRKLEPVAVTLLCDNGTRYNPSDFEPYLPDAPLTQTRAREGRSDIPRLVTVIPEGARDNTLTSMAGTMHRRGFGEQAIYAALAVANADQCVPPLPDADVARIANSVAGYALDDNTAQAVDSRLTTATPKFMWMSEVQPEQVEWLWYPYIPLRKLTLIDGDPGQGKSWITIALAAAVSRGDGFPETEPLNPAKVLLLATEDGHADTVRPRLDTFSAAVEHIAFPADPLTLDEGGFAALEALFIAVSPRLVIVDPLVGFIGANVDINRANQTRAVLQKLAALAEQYNCAIVLVRHITKSGKDHAIYRGLGSIDIAAACRSVLLAGSDPNDPKKRALVQIKSNLGPIGPAIGYAVEHDGPHDVGRFSWTGASDLTAARILAAESPGEDSSAAEDAESFLYDLLANGPVAATEVEREAKRLGISGSTLNRAKKKVRAKSIRSGEAGGRGKGEWSWVLVGPAVTTPLEHPAHQDRHAG